MGFAIDFCIRQCDHEHFSEETRYLSVGEACGGFGLGLVWGIRCRRDIVIVLGWLFCLFFIVGIGWALSLFRNWLDFDFGSFLGVRAFSGSDLWAIGVT